MPARSNPTALDIGPVESNPAALNIVPPPQPNPTAPEMAPLQSNQAALDMAPVPSNPAALDIALRYLAPRPRSEQELRRRLQRAGVAEVVVDRVLEQLRQRGLVDDAAFARYWLEQRQTFRPRGARLLRAELRRHGIPPDLVAAAAAELASSADADAYRAAQKRAVALATLAVADERAFKSRLAQFLTRRGFDWEATSSAVERLYQEVNS